jgi:hypothetical protein
MKLRNIVKLPSALLYVALVVYSRRRQWLRGAAHGVLCAGVVIALAIFVVMFAGRIGAVAY